jgi:hypothetical protein
MSENTLSHAFESEGESFHATTHHSVLRGNDQSDSPSRHEKGLYLDRNCQQAVEQALNDSEEVEQRIAATLKQITSDLSRLQRVQQTQFAFSDTLAKALQTGLPEQSSARGKDRYDRFLKSAAASMINGPHPWLRDELEQWHYGAAVNRNRNPAAYAAKTGARNPRRAQRGESDAAQ